MSIGKTFRTLKDMQTSLSGYRILDHPADLGFQAWAPTLPDLFAECGKALTSVFVDVNTIARSDIQAVEIIGDDLESLLYNWLSEILYLFDGEKRLFSEFAILSHQQNSPTEFLQAELRGEQFDRDKHEIKTYVKAVTYHQLSIQRGESGYSASVYLDI